MKLVITEPAKWHLKAIHDYYKEKVSPKIADKIKAGIIEKLKYLQQYPLTGRRKNICKRLTWAIAEWLRGITK